jgi:predicted nucleotidyltransferase
MEASSGSAAAILEVRLPADGAGQLLVYHQQAMKNHGDSGALVAALGQALGGRTDVRLAMLFGSRARGRGRSDSDVDLAVEADGVDLLKLAADLSLAVGLEVDVVDLREAGYPLLKAVLRDGVAIHQGQRGALGSWRSQAISRVELDRAWFERMRDGFLSKLVETHG